MATLVLLNLFTERGGQFTIGFVFWLLMLLWLILGFVWYWPRGAPPPTAYPAIGGHVLIFVLFLLLGIAIFGFPIG